VATLQPVSLPVVGARLAAEVAGPPAATGVVVLARGTGSCRHDPRHRAVADRLHRAGLGTVLVDLLTDAEERSATADAVPPDPALLAARLVGVVDWTAAQPLAGGRPIGVLGSSAASGAALAAAANRPGSVRAVAVVPSGHPLPGGQPGPAPVLVVLRRDEDRPDEAGEGGLEVLESPGPGGPRGEEPPLDMPLDTLADALASWLSGALRA
jgi:putative phosphoribosyl transferase